MNIECKKLSNIELDSSPLIDSPDIERRIAAGDFGRWSSHAWWLSKMGYCIVELQDEEFNHDCQNIIDTIGSQLESELRGWENGHTEAPRVQDAWKISSSVRRLALHPLILDLLRTLYGREPFAFQTLNFAVGSQQPCHSDSVHFHSLPHGFMCGVWIPLADVAAESGPLLYYPGSHRFPYLSAAGLGMTPDQVAAEDHPQRFFEPQWQHMIQQKRLSPKHFLARRGEVLIWHANLLHGGSSVGNRFARRWSQVVHYFFADCIYTTPLSSFSADQGGAVLRNPYDIATGSTRWSRSEWTKLDLRSHPSVLQTFASSSDLNHAQISPVLNGK